ncbi:hypothetical protein [Flavobacterium aquiphilum]|uniref:hypothetical protein n=1 Tax=Flavobacterium aquiphilum TaxID=3003261 RepID=UPI0024817849|nr:hypothetical protein [Flavobacterium aquiphilum]
MKKIILFLSILFLFSCNKKENDYSERNKYLLDSLKVSQLAKERVDSMLNSSTKASYLDTTGQSKSPILITKSSLIKEEYSNSKNIKLFYKNISKKKIESIRFEWYGENAFHEPADMGNLSILGEGGGFTDEPISPNKSSYGTWSIHSKDAKKIISARAYEVAFSDGTIWKLRKD